MIGSGCTLGKYLFHMMVPRPGQHQALVHAEKDMNRPIILRGKDTLITP